MDIRKKSCEKEDRRHDMGYQCPMMCCMCMEHMMHMDSYPREHSCDDYSDYRHDKNHANDEKWMGMMMTPMMCPMACMEHMQPMGGMQYPMMDMVSPMGGMQYPMMDMVSPMGEMQYPMMDMVSPMGGMQHPMMDMTCPIEGMQPKNQSKPDMVAPKMDGGSKKPSIMAEDIYEKDMVDVKIKTVDIEEIED